MKLKNWIVLNFKSTKSTFFIVSFSSPRVFHNLGTWNDKEIQLVFDMSKIVNQKYMQTFLVIHGEYFYNNYFYYYLIIIFHNYFLIPYYPSNKDDTSILEQQNYLDPSQ